MRQLVLSIVACAVLVAAWFALDAMLGGAPDLPPAASPSAGERAATVPNAADAGLADEAGAESAANSGGGATQRTAALTTGSLEVVVRWAVDGAVAEDVAVRLRAKSSGQRIATAVTDERGVAAFADLEPGTFLPGVRRAQVVDPPTLLVEAGAVARHEIAILGDVRLRILVVDGAGTPQPDAVVWASDPYEPEEMLVRLGRCDAGGELRYRGFPPYGVYARAAGRQPSAHHELPRQDPAEPSGELLDVRLVLGPAGCVLVGTVVDPEGRPVAGARVAVACDDAIGGATKRAEVVAHADDAGRFTCDELPPGERFVVADFVRFAPAIARVTTTAAQPTAVALTLRRGATLTGRVTSAEGNPLVGVMVFTSLRSRPTGLSHWMGGQRQARTAADGRYRVAAIAPGEARVTVQIEPAARRMFTFGDGDEVTWDVARPADRGISGVVLDADDQPLAGWQVNLQVQAGWLRDLATRTDAEGRFRIGALEDVDHRLFVFAPRGEGQSGAAAMVPRAVRNGVRPSAEELTIRLEAGAVADGWLEGTITMPPGEEAAATISVYAAILRGGGFAVPQERLAAGQPTFSIGPLAAGDYDLLCDIEGRGRLEQRGVQLRVGETLRLPPFAADAQRPLELVLAHADGRPATGAVMTVQGIGGACREVAPGRYRSVPLAPGALEVAVHGPDFAPCTFPLEFTVATRPFARTVSAGTPVQVVLRPAAPRERWIGALRVRLRDGAGNQVLRTMVQIDGGADFTWPIGLSPGSYALDVDVMGEGVAAATFTVGGAPLRVDLQLAK